jgi:signal transduction histidine kinase
MGKDAKLRMFVDTTDVVEKQEARAKDNYQRMLLGYISHEFRTPLNALYSNIELLLLKATNPYY